MTTFTKKMTVDGVEFVVPTDKEVMEPYITDWVETKETFSTEDGMNNIECICDNHQGYLSAEIFGSYVKMLAHTPKTNLSVEQTARLDAYIKFFQYYVDVLTHLKTTLASH
jgi:hypothetical protein